MKIAIATNDRKEIAHRTGRAIEFAIYTIENNEIVEVEYKENLHHHHHDHEDDEEHHRRHQGNGHGKGHGHRHHHHEHNEGEHHHDEVVEALQGVDYLLYKALGKYMRKDMEDAKIKLQRTNNVKIDKIVEEFINNQ